MAGYKKSSNAKPIISITLEDDLLDKVVDFQFQNREKNRARAVETLVKLGFEKLEEMKKEKKQTTDYIAKSDLIRLINQL